MILCMHACLANKVYMCKMGYGAVEDLNLF